MRVLLVVLVNLCAVVGATPQGRLQVEAQRWAEAWEAKDSRSLTALMAERGVRLRLPGEEYMLIKPRQAAAALQVFLGRYGPGETRITRLSPAGETSEEGFAEIRWVTGSPGMTDPVIFTLFVGYTLEGGSWSVSEIRVLF